MLKDGYRRPVWEIREFQDGNYVLKLVYMHEYSKIHSRNMQK